MIIDPNGTKFQRVSKEVTATDDSIVSGCHHNSSLQDNQNIKNYTVKRFRQTIFSILTADALNSGVFVTVSLA